MFKYEHKAKLKSSKSLQLNLVSDSTVQTCAGRNGGYGAITQTTLLPLFLVEDQAMSPRSGRHIVVSLWVLHQLCVSMVSVQVFATSRCCVSTIMQFLHFTITLLSFCAKKIKVMSTSPLLKSSRLLEQVKTVESV